MRARALGCSFLAVATALAMPSRAADCPAGKSFVLTRAVAPVVGQSPLWLTTGRGPTMWQDRDRPVEVLLIRDLSVRGAAIVTGQNRTTGAKARFGRTGSTLGIREERFRLEAMGSKPRTATAADLERYSFHMTDAWFPEPGCYEISARVGAQQSTIVLQVGKRGGT